MVCRRSIWPGRWALKYQQTKADNGSFPFRNQVVHMMGSRVAEPVKVYRRMISVTDCG